MYKFLFGIMDTACVLGIANGLLLFAVGDAACFIGSFKVNLQWLPAVCIVFLKIRSAPLVKNKYAGNRLV